MKRVRPVQTDEVKVRTKIGRKRTRTKSIDHLGNRRLISRFLSTEDERHVDTINRLQVGRNKADKVIQTTEPSADYR